MPYMIFDEKKIFDFLTNEEIPDSRECFEFLKNYYIKNEGTELYRHLYSEISESLDKYRDEQKEQICAILYETLQNDELWDEEHTELRKTATKLYDHVSLEVKHSHQNENRYEEIKKIYNNNLKEKTVELEGLIKTVQDEVCNQKQELKNNSKELTTNTLTIMSIFTAVVFAAITSFDAITSISVAIIGKYGLWGTLIALAGVAVVTIDVFYILLRFICVVIGKDNFISTDVVKNINFIAGAIMLALVILNVVCPQYIIS